MGEKSKMPSGCGVWFISSIISVGTLEGSQVWEDEVSFGQSEFEVPVGHPSVGFSWAIKIKVLEFGRYSHFIAKGEHICRETVTVRIWDNSFFYWEINGNDKGVVEEGCQGGALSQKPGEERL